MTRLRPEDLPPKARARLLAAAGKPARKGKSRAGIGDGVACAGRCSCGERFAKASAWERHSKAHGAGHSVWRIDLPGEEPHP